ncbi:hypothetical protein A1F95_08663, partial [Pyrenophora tritici-repentis]
MRNKRRRPVSRVDPYIAYRRSKDLSAKFERVLSAIHRSALVSDNDDEWKVASELSEEFQSVLRDWQDTSTIDRILDLPFLAYTLDTQGATSYDKLLISGSVLNYYRTKSEREAGCKEYGMIMFDQICTKVFEHREGLDTGDGRSKEYSLETMLIPVIVQCAELNKIEMFHRGIRGLKGATIDAYSRLLYLVPDISFSKIVEGLEIAVESLKAIEEHGIDASDAKIPHSLSRNLPGLASGISALNEKGGEALPDTNTPSKDLRIELDRFYVAKMEQLLIT